MLVIGPSIGGWIAAEMAVRERRRISGTVLINAVGIDVEGIRLADFFALSRDELMERSFHHPAKFKIDPATLTSEQQQAQSGPVIPERPRLQLIPEAGHLPHIEQPENVLRHIQAFAAETCHIRVA